MAAARLTLCALLLSAPALAEAPRLLSKSGLLCDADQTFCIRGSLWYRPDSRILLLDGRIQRAPGPGWVTIVFRGTSRNNQPASAIMEFPVRGRYSEIVDRKFIPDNPPVSDWRIDRLSFAADEDARRAAQDRR